MVAEVVNDARKLVFDRIVAGLVEELESTRAELEACRAERDNAGAWFRDFERRYLGALDRAEHAEATIARVEALLDGWSLAAVDARITAALRAALRGEPLDLE